MKYLKQLREGERITEIYLCKHRSSAVTKNGKPYDTVILQDKTANLEGKIWEPSDAGIDDFEDLDYIQVTGEVTSFNGALQVNIKRARKCREGEYDPAEYLPVSKRDKNEMLEELNRFIASVKNEYLNRLLKMFFVDDAEFIKRFSEASAAKSVHHGFIGGLLEHTLSVTNLCDFFASRYPVLNRDLLISAALLHDIGKVKEISAFPINDYTDEGNLLGHIVMGSEMVSEKAASIEGFPIVLLNELKHCILAHHGELEFGSPKKPSLVEALALHFADNIDAKMETFTEIFEGTEEKGWLGFNRMLDNNIRATKGE